MSANALKEWSSLLVSWTSDGWLAREDVYRCHTNVDGSASARSAESAVAKIAGPRWRTLPLISNRPGRVGDTVTMTPGTWSGPVVNSRATEMMRCTNVWSAWWWSGRGASASPRQEHACVDLAGGSGDDGLVPRVDPGKTLTDQVDEIEKLIFDAQQLLSQATYALETLKERIVASSGGSERPDD